MDFRINLPCANKNLEMILVTLMTFILEMIIFKCINNKYLKRLNIYLY